MSFNLNLQTSEDVLRLYEKALEESLKIEEENGKKFRQRRTLLFEIGYPLKYGQNLHVVGSIESLGYWDVHKSFSLNWTPSHLWRNTLSVSTEDEIIEFKYVIKNDNGDVIWEPGPNHRVNVNVPNIIIRTNDVWGITNIIEPSRITA